VCPAITSTGGEVLGHRPLELDGLQPATFVDGNSIQKWFTKLRPEDTARFPLCHIGATMSSTHWPASAFSDKAAERLKFTRREPLAGPWRQ